MKMKPCPDCNGIGKGNELWYCYICEGTGTMPTEPVSHCQGCGEPIELGLEWCQLHRPTADLWQALQEEQ